MHLLKNILLAFGFTSILFGWFVKAPSAAACSCAMPTSATEQFNNADTVFEGRVVEITVRDMEKTVVFDVSSSLKGSNDEKLSLTTGLGGGDCGFNFQVGQQYLVYAHEQAGKLSTGICSGTSLIDEALAPFEEPTEEPTLPREIVAAPEKAPSIAPIVLAMLGIGILATYVVARKLKN